MSDVLDGLHADFRTKLAIVRQRCQERGYHMRPSTGIRTPLVQARLWRQSRSIEEIRARIAQFRDEGADFLADCLVAAGPQAGRQVTNAPPGLSWHQWGEAVDCFWLVDGKAEWSTTRKIGGANAYHVYAEQAEALGLNAGGLWKKLKDWPHAQLSPAASPLHGRTLAEISETMRERFDLHS